jgi:hypothetical protein
LVRPPRDGAGTRVTGPAETHHLAADICVTASDLVFHSRKIAVVFDMAARHRLDPPVWKRLPPAARIVAAERVSGAWAPGFEIPNPFDRR